MDAAEMVLADEASLVCRLGIEAGHRVLILNPPEGYYRRLGALPPGALVNVGAQASFDVVQVFVRTRAELADQLATALAALRPGGRRGSPTRWPGLAACLASPPAGTGRRWPAGGSRRSLTQPSTSAGQPCGLSRFYRRLQADTVARPWDF